MTVLAIAAAIGLYTLFTLPAAMLWRTRRGEPAAWLGATIVVVAFLHTGLIGGGGDIPALSQPSRDRLQAGKCKEMMTLLQANGVVLEEPSGERLIVRQALWAQLPELVRQVATTCAGETLFANPQGSDIEVIER